MKYAIGIDPGRSSGGVCIIEHDGGYADLTPMPDMAYLAKKLFRLQEVTEEGELFCGIEKAQSFPGQGISSAFGYGDHFGQLQGLMIALKIPYALIPPKTWAKEVQCGTLTKLDPKKRSLEAARRLFPQVSLLATERCKKPHSGMYEALLIAEYVRRKHL